MSPKQFTILILKLSYFFFTSFGGVYRSSPAALYQFYVCKQLENNLHAKSTSGLGSLWLLLYFYSNDKQVTKCVTMNYVMQPTSLVHELQGCLFWRTDMTVMQNGVWNPYC